MPSYSKMSNAQLLAALKQMRDETTANTAAYNMTNADLAPLDTSATALEERMANLVDLKEAFDAGKVDLKNVRKTAQAAITERAGLMSADTSIADVLKEAAGVPTSETDSSAALNVPLNVSSLGYSNGTNTVKFNRNGNRQGTQFIVEYRESETGAWLIAGTTTSQIFNHTGRTPGVRTYYRLKAQRAGQTSPASSESVVYA